MKNKGKQNQFQFKYSFKAYGVFIGIESNLDLQKEINETLDLVLPLGHEKINWREIEHLFTIERKEADLCGLYKNGEVVVLRVSSKILFEFFKLEVRNTIIEFAVNRIFIHAGAVAWKGKSIIFPAQSLEGKSSLTVEFIKRGATYYSDDFAVIDEEGQLHPFPRLISLRTNIHSYVQENFPPEKFNAKVGIDHLPVGMVLITRYESEAQWKPEVLSAGEGIMKILPHTATIRDKPEFTLNVLNKMIKNAIIVETKRNEAKKFVDLLLQYFERKVDLA